MVAVNGSSGRANDDRAGSVVDRATVTINRAARTIDRSG
jgi:hypothetical protein